MGTLGELGFRCHCGFGGSSALLRISWEWVTFTWVWVGLGWVEIYVGLGFWCFLVF